VIATEKSDGIITLHDRNTGSILVNPNQIVSVFSIENGNVCVLVTTTGLRFEVRMPLAAMREIWLRALRGETDALPDPRDTPPLDLGSRAKNKAGSLPQFR
jgi:hypothetical protein